MVTKRTSSSKPAQAQSADGVARAGNYALITGASSGIGEALAHGLAAKGFDVVLVARSADKLKAQAADLRREHNIDAQVAAADLTRPGAAQNLANLLARKGLNLRVLVNCAGVLSHGAFLNMAPEKVQQMIDLNITSLTTMLRAFVPGMVENVANRGGRAHVLNVASIAAFQPIPMLAAYAASKAYVLSLSESLAEELKGTGVSVTALCPGITATNMLSGAASENSKLGAIPSFLIADVNDVARAGLQATLRGDAICVPGAINQIGMLGSRATPKWLVRKIGGMFGRNTV
jgi:uncharacterized protein